MKDLNFKKKLAKSLELAIRACRRDRVPHEIIRDAIVNLRKIRGLIELAEKQCPTT